MIIYLSHDDGDDDDDDDDDLEDLHLDWVTARPCIACALNPTINTEIRMRVTTMMRICSPPVIIMACSWLGSPSWARIATAWAPLTLTQIALRVSWLTASYCINQHLSQPFQPIKSLICAFKQGHKFSAGSPGNLQCPLIAT